jgi:hypothetical protein
MSSGWFLSSSRHFLTYEVRRFIAMYGWEDNIEMDFKEIAWQHVDSIHLAEDRD